MKNNYIAKSAHGSSGASELNTRGAGVLMSAEEKMSTPAGMHKMKTFLFSFLAFAPVLCFGYLSSSDFTTINRVLIYSYSSPSSSNFVYHSQGNLTPENVHIPFYTSVVGVRFNSEKAIVQHPSLNLYQTNNVPHTGNIDQPIEASVVYETGMRRYPVSPFPRISSLFTLVVNLYTAGYRGSGFRNIYTGVTPSRDGDTIVNFYFPDILTDVFSGTNSAWRSTVLDCLNSLDSHVASLDINLSSVNSSLSSLHSSYVSNNPFSDNNISNLVQSAFDLSLIDSPTYEGWMSDLSEFSQPQYANSSLPSLVQSSILNSLNSLGAVSGTLQGLYNSSFRDQNFNDAFNAMGNSFGRGASVHYTTPLTNEMQRMSTNWVQETKSSLSNWVEETKAALSNNTQKIKDDLQAWKDQLSGPNGSQAAIVSKLDGAINGQGAVKVEVQNSNNELHVNVNGPVELKATQFNDINNKLQANFDQFHEWVHDIPESWVRYYYLFRDNSSAILTNQFAHTALLSSLTNLVSDFSFDFSDFSLGFSSNTTFAVSNALLGLSFSPTNELWDYYFDRFKKANEFNDDSGLHFSLDLFRQQVFGSGFDESKFRQLDWFSRVELLLYQIAYAETNDVPEAADIETELEDVEETISTHAEDFVATSVKVVSVFNLLKRFADSVKLAFTPQNGELSPLTSGIVLLQGGSWLVNEPLVLNVPVPIQNALRLVFQCIWYLGAFVLGWRVFSAAWDRVVAVVRWIWSVFDI